MSAACEPLLPLIPWYSLGAEIGVAKGESSERLITARKCFMVLIDPWCDYEGYPEQLGSGNAFDTCMARLRPYSLMWIAMRLKSADAAASIVTARPFDWVYIDANHTYDYVLADCRAWWSHLRPGGLLCGHDWNLAVFDYGVQRAVTAFADEMKLKINVHGEPKREELQCWSIVKP